MAHQVIAHTHRFGDYLAHYDKEDNRCVIKKINHNVPMSDHFIDCTDSHLEAFNKTCVPAIEATEYFKQLNNKGESRV